MSRKLRSDAKLTCSRCGGERRRSLGKIKCFYCPSCTLARTRARRSQQRATFVGPIRRMNPVGLGGSVAKLVCPKCGDARVRQECTSNGRRRVNYKCRRCENQRLRELLRMLPKSVRRKHNLKKRFAMTHADYEALLAAQGGGCAICGRQDSARRWGNGELALFHIDHNHITGATRGILCQRCNLGLGHMWDDPALLLAGAAYLQHHIDRQAMP